VSVGQLAQNALGEIDSRHGNIHASPNVKFAIRLETQVSRRKIVQENAWAEEPIAQGELVALPPQDSITCEMSEESEHQFTAQDSSALFFAEYRGTLPEGVELGAQYSISHPHWIDDPTSSIRQIARIDIVADHLFNDHHLDPRSVILGQQFDRNIGYTSLWKIPLERWAEAEALLRIYINGVSLDAAMAMIGETLQHGFIFVQGPPGTGKTHFAALVLYVVAMIFGKKVLVTADKRAALEVFVMQKFVPLLEALKNKRCR
jgi:hypothetical protein